MSHILNVYRILHPSPVFGPSCALARPVRIVTYALNTSFYPVILDTINELSMNKAQQKCHKNVNSLKREKSYRRSTS